MMIHNKRKGFSLVEVVVVIAVMVVLMAILAPALLSYVENSRMRRDDSAMDEVVNAFQLALTDAATFDEAYSYCIPNNYVTYSDSSGHYSQQLNDEEYWAPDGSGPAVTITFNPENGKYNINEGIVNDMTFGNGSVAEQRTAEGVKQCYLHEMGKALLFSSVKQTIGESIRERSATYKNSSYTVFIRFKIVDGTRQADVYGLFNGTNLHEGCPAAIGSNTSSYDEENKPISTNPSGGRQNSNFSNTDLLGGGSIGGAGSSKPLPTYRQCKNGHTFDEINPVLAERCVCTVCYVTEHKFYEKGTTMKCERCSYAKEHECKGNPCPLCGAIPFTVTAGNRHKVGFTGEENEKLEIPETFIDTDGKRYRVVSIGSHSFNGCNSLTSVNIPDGVTRIDIGAFQNCSSLTSINIPDGVTSIRSYAFAYCSSLTSINIPDSVTSFEACAFAWCSSLTSINIPDGVTSIGYQTFRGCSSLTSINIPDSVTIIDSWAFEGCSKLTSINIPDGVTSIGGDAFRNCGGLTSIHIPNSVTSIGNSAFYGCKRITSINIPDGVTSIGVHAFQGCSSLTSINIPDGVTSIGDGAFFGCSSLTSIIIPDGVTSIGDYAFQYCYNLSSLNIPDGVTSIGNCAFYNCKRITSINIPDGVTSIGEQTFRGCGNLTNITFQGTQEQWNGITKGGNWKSYVPSSCIVHCTDGDISIADA